MVGVQVVALIKSHDRVTVAIYQRLVNDNGLWPVGRFTTKASFAAEGKRAPRRRTLPGPANSPILPGKAVETDG